MQYIIFLRAINVAGKNIIKMAALREALSDAGFLNVQTYIQSGNIILESDMEASLIVSIVAGLLISHFQLEVDVFVLTKEDLLSVIAQNPIAPELEAKHTYITFLSEVPLKALHEALKKIDFGEEQFFLKSNILYYYLPNGMANSKMNNSFFEKKLKLRSSARNLNTIKKMLELAG